jgi:hypothetical protein
VPSGCGMRTGCYWTSSATLCGRLGCLFSIFLWAGLVFSPPSPPTLPAARGGARGAAAAVDQGHQDSASPSDEYREGLAFSSVQSRTTTNRCGPGAQQPAPTHHHNILLLASRRSSCPCKSLEPAAGSWDAQRGSCKLRKRYAHPAAPPPGTNPPRTCRLPLLARSGSPLPARAARPAVRPDRHLCQRLGLLGARLLD